MSAGSWVASISIIVGLVLAYLLGYKDGEHKTRREWEEWELKVEMDRIEKRS